MDFVRTLLAIITRMRPRKGGGGAGGSGGGGDRGMPRERAGWTDDTDRAKKLTQDVYGDASITANMADDPRLGGASSTLA